VTTSSVTVDSSHGGDEQPRVISEILEQERRQTNAASANHDTSKMSLQVSNDSNASRQQEVAATKIQAGIRGFLDRKKVKAIRANQQNAGQKKPEDNIMNYESGAGDDGRLVLTDVKSDVTSEESTDPKLHTAATKIQANYKGYKTRKQLNIKKK